MHKRFKANKLFVHVDLLLQLLCAGGCSVDEGEDPGDRGQEEETGQEAVKARTAGHTPTYHTV